MNRDICVKRATVLLVAMSCVALSAVEGAADSTEKRVRNIADQELFFAPVPKAVCGPGDKPETALQGQVPAAMRAAGFQGFSCNLQLLAQAKGDGANWQTAEWREGGGKTKKVCAYHGTAAPTANPGMARTNYGVRVIDITDPTKPNTTAYLTTRAMLDPWESLKMNERRQLIAAANGANGGGGPEIDVYDASGDCRYPQLLASRAIGVDPNIEPVAPVVGHEGSWAPDGLTYYGGIGYFAVDMTDTTKPKLISTWRLQDDVPGAFGGHGMSVSDDGTRGYFVSLGREGAPGDLTNPNVPAKNGLVIYDLSDIQFRRPNPRPRVVSKILWKDGSYAQHTIRVTIGRKPYVVSVDEAGSGGVTNAAQLAAACAAGLAPFPMARTIDISDEMKPKVVSKLMLETHDSANCDKVSPDLVGLSTLTYGSHYCSVDNIHRATTLACGYFNSGLRVFDIRDPIRPREIAYYNPPGTTTASPGSNHNRGGGWVAGGPDWCSAQVHLDADQGTMWSTCQDNGLLMLKFTHNAWPFAETRTPPGMQN